MENIDIKKFVANKVKSNPSLYGGDKGNTHLVYDYFKEIKGIDIPKYFDSTSNSLIRAKNMFLEKEPKFDYRKINKGIFTGLKFNPLNK
ncbi:MAG: hypothetical protein K8R39_11860 [Arcobacteraceae bacterium]|nr:hypothetical protein [Arcobacteraceae bacterium]